MSPGQNGYQDDPEDETEMLGAFEDMGKYDEWEGWPEDMAGPVYWLYKGLMEKERVTPQAD